LFLDKFGALGGLLFLVSDSLLAIWKFGGHLSLPEPLEELVGQSAVMVTYYAAQFCIALTMLDRFPEEDKRDWERESTPEKDNQKKQQMKQMRKSLNK